MSPGCLELSRSKSKHAPGNTSTKTPPSSQTSSVSAALGHGALTHPGTESGTLLLPASARPARHPARLVSLHMHLRVPHPSPCPRPPKEAAPVPHLDCPHSLAAGVPQPASRLSSQRDLSRTLLRSHHTLLTTLRKLPVASGNKDSFLSYYLFY